MTESEAIKFLNNYVIDARMGMEVIAKTSDFLNVCEKAIEKQIPKKPDIEGDGYADGHLVYDTWICPNCEKHYEIEYDDYEYCPNCGQHIDRSELN